MVVFQKRSNNAANELTAIDTKFGSDWADPAYDRNGNMTTIPQPAAPTSAYTCTYDAWNRLVKVETTAPATVGQYTYDGMGRRIRKYVPGTTDSYQHFYYTSTRQVIETRESDSSPVPTSAQYQYVWSLRYLDAPVLRDDIAADPDKRLYYTGDANFNVTSLLNTSGSAVERYVYDAYGQLTIYNADWSATQNPTDNNNSTLYTGQWRDAETGLSNYRFRYYDPRLGRFITPDPIGYNETINLYEYTLSSPNNGVDPSGLTPATVSIVDDKYDDLLKLYGYEEKDRPTIHVEFAIQECRIKVSGKSTSGVSGVGTGAAIEFKKFGFGGIVSVDFDFAVLPDFEVIQKCPSACGHCCIICDGKKRNIHMARVRLDVKVLRQHVITGVKKFGSSKTTKETMRSLLGVIRFHTQCTCRCDFSYPKGCKLGSIVKGKDWAKKGAKCNHGHWITRRDGKFEKDPEGTIADPSIRN